MRGSSHSCVAMHDHLQEDQLSVCILHWLRHDSPENKSMSQQLPQPMPSFCHWQPKPPDKEDQFFFFSLGTPTNTWVFCLSLISYFSLISLNKTCFCFAYLQECLFHHWHEQMNSGASVPGTWVKHNRAKNCTIVLKTRQDKTRQDKTTKRNPAAVPLMLSIFFM